MGEGSKRVLEEVKKEEALGRSKQARGSWKRQASEKFLEEEVKKQEVVGRSEK